MTNTQEDAASFGLSAGDEVYPFYISIYVRGTSEKQTRSLLCDNYLAAGGYYTKVCRSRARMTCTLTHPDIYNKGIIWDKRTGGR